MRRYIAQIIKRAREERGLSQRTLINTIGSHVISLRTLKRIESSANNVTPELIDELLAFFDIRLKYNLINEYENKIMQDALDNIPEEMTIKDCIEEVNGRIEEYRCMYHAAESLMREYHINSLADFLIYYPLFDKEQLNESLRRIGGDIHGRFYYVLDQLERLYINIPQSEAKNAADELVNRALGADGPTLEEYNTYMQHVFGLKGAT